LQNHSNYSWYRKPERQYLSNLPSNVEASEAAFGPHRALLWKSALQWRPGLRYSIRNGRKSPMMNAAPLLQLLYQKGIPYSGLGDDAADFDQVELGLAHHLNFGVSGRLDFNLQGGRSEEHTSELQSREKLVCRLLLEKKKNNNVTHVTYDILD